LTAITFLNQHGIDLIYPLDPAKELNALAEVIEKCAACEIGRDELILSHALLEWTCFCFLTVELDQSLTVKMLGFPVKVGLNLVLHFNRIKAFFQIFRFWLILFHIQPLEGK
jgi:hypothetical protein